MELSNGSFKLDFLGIGVSRGGSTWIDKCLGVHPQICMSSQKELNFFNNNKYKKLGLEWLKKYYTHKVDGQILGEYSPSTLTKTNVEGIINAIKDHNPEMKFIVCLRNPIARSWSQYMKHKLVGAGGLNQKETLEEAVERDEMAYYRYIKKSMYAKNLKIFLSSFPQENFFILFHEDSKNNQSKFIQSIYSFLGVDDTFRSNIFIKEINRTGKHVAYYPQLNRNIDIISKKVPRVFKKGLLKIKCLNNQKKSVKKDRIPQKTREFLQKKFADDIKNVEAIIGRKLDFWN